MYLVGLKLDAVSIQLVSPASGELAAEATVLYNLYCFHSISFPSEWGDLPCPSTLAISSSFHSISFPSEWGVGIIEVIPCSTEAMFPFN